MRDDRRAVAHSIINDLQQVTPGDTDPFPNRLGSTRHVGVASRICRTWKGEITSGNGRYFNGNLAAKERKYDEVGVGMIERRDSATRAILDDKVTCYARKGCYFAEAQTGTKVRLLNKGNWPKAKDPRKDGRPEKPPEMRPALLKQVFSEKTRRFSPMRAPSEPAKPPLGY